MKPRPRLLLRDRAGFITLLLASGSLSSMHFTCPLVGAEATSTAETPQTGRIVYLNRVDVPYTFVNSAFRFERQSAPFAKEPAVEQRQMLRGMLSLGSGANNDALGFLWDRSQGTVYLDLNRNRDLTDDDDGVYTTGGPESRSTLQVFRNVQLTFPRSVGPEIALVDLNLYSYGLNRFGGYAALRSFYQGKVTFGSRDWQIGIVNIGSSYLILRPWEEREKPFSLTDGTLTGFNHVAGRNLFFQNEAWSLNHELVMHEGAVRCKLDLQPVRPDLGELRLEGQFIDRLVLDSSDYTVVLDQPGPVVQIPRGSFTTTRVQLRQGDVLASRQLPVGPRGSPLIVESGRSASLVIGGPLTNTVVPMRRGSSLVLNYRLVGADGLDYVRVNQDRLRPPRFTVFQGEDKVASGQFEFG